MMFYLAKLIPAELSTDLMTIPVIEPVIEACNLNHVTWRSEVGAVAFH
jgi:hypothetical protein